MVSQRGEEAVVCLLEAGSSGPSMTGIRNSEGYSLPTHHHGLCAAVGSGQAVRGSSGVSQGGLQSGAAGVHCFAKWQTDGHEAADSSSEFRRWNDAVKHDERDVLGQYQAGR